jgi:hypothetical protein
MGKRDRLAQLLFRPQLLTYNGPPNGEESLEIQKAIEDVGGQ